MDNNEEVKKHLDQKMSGLGARLLSRKTSFNDTEKKFE